MTPFSKCLSLTVGFHILFTGYREVMPLYTPCSLVIYSPVNFSLVFILSRLQFYKLLFLNFYLRDYTLFIIHRTAGQWSSILTVSVRIAEKEHGGQLSFAV